MAAVLELLEVRPKASREEGAAGYRLEWREQHPIIGNLMHCSIVARDLTSLSQMLLEHLRRNRPTILRPDFESMNENQLHGWIFSHRLEGATLFGHD